jgi:ribonuclease HI
MRAAINWAVDVCFNLITVKDNEKGVREPLTIQQWQAPAVNTLKVNVDGAFLTEEGIGAVGAVARDSDGNFVMAISRRLPAVSSALAAEAVALREGVNLIHMVTTGPVVLETDSLELVHLWDRRATQRSEFTSLFREVEDMSGAFSSFSVMHTRRTTNTAAHLCAKSAVSSEFEVWANVPPSFLVQTLHNDCNHVP